MGFDPDGLSAWAVVAVLTSAEGWRGSPRASSLVPASSCCVTSHPPSEASKGTNLQSAPICVESTCERANTLTPACDPKLSAKGTAVTRARGQSRPTPVLPAQVRREALALWSQPVCVNRPCVGALVPHLRLDLSRVPEREAAGEGRGGSTWGRWAVVRPVVLLATPCQ